MTTPVDTWPEPYALVLKGAGSLSVYIDHHTEARYHPLPQGATTLMVTTTSTKSCRISVTPQASVDNSTLLGVIPEGTGSRSLSIPNVGVGRNETRFLRVDVGEGLAATTDRAVVNVVTIPLQA